MKNKKADLLMDPIVFILLNLVVFGALFLFVINASSGAFILENFYAKQIALILDDVKPGTTISLDITDAAAVAKENELHLDRFVKIEDGYVITRLSNSRSYRFPFFSEVVIGDTGFEIKDPGSKNEKVFLNIYIAELEEENE